MSHEFYSNNSTDHFEETMNSFGNTMFEEQQSAAHSSFTFFLSHFLHFSLTLGGPHEQWRATVTLFTLLLLVRIK